MGDFLRRSIFLLLLIGARLVLAQAPTSATEAELMEKENVVEGQRIGTAWQAAEVGVKLAAKDKIRTGEFSRAVVRFQDRSMMRMDELTTFEVTAGGKAGVNLRQGGLYFFSRERAPEINIQTPAANGSLRGTQLVVRVSPTGQTSMTVFEGVVELANPQGRVTLRSGEQGQAEIGQAPHKTAVIEAANIIQWALYYPAVLDPRELGLAAGEARAVAASLEAYREGDLLGALEKYPAGHRPDSAAGRLYRAGVLLAVGRVDRAREALRGVPVEAPGRRALEEMIAAVKNEEWSGAGEPRTASEWMAHSYYRQAKADLEGALAAARRAVELAPDFGYAPTRVAELEFSFGRTRPALEALSQGLVQSPRNAQAHALQGFLLSANNSVVPARAAFERAIQLDGALGNAWLGRGLTYMRQGQTERGQIDLQTAATLEPNRSILHSYLGKGFSELADATSARKDYRRAMELDPKDPTPWLYSALENKAENRYNAALRDLETSLELNDNRRVYRSRFLLDQDRSVRSTNLAAIYLNDGMVDVSVREAVRAVDADYASAAAHLFLSNSYDALRDPRRILLRYETPWFNELLLSQLLAPVGGGSLSQFVSQQEYSKLFEGDGLGFSTRTDYDSMGKIRSTNSQYGTFGNLSYALDSEYYYDNGQRPNSRISRLENYASFKLQLSPQDTVFFRINAEDFTNGDIFRRYDDREVGRETTVRTMDPVTGELTKTVLKNTTALTYEAHERQEPGFILLGYHHEWSPGVHTLFLFNRLANEQDLGFDQFNQLVLTRDISSLFPANFAGTRSLANPSFVKTLNGLRGQGEITQVNGVALDTDYRASFEVYSGEVNQIITLGPQTFVFGGRFQKGTFYTQSLFNGLSPDLRASGVFLDPPALNDTAVDFERINLYAYDTWKVAPWLSVTGGVTWDKLRYPQNFRSPPVNDQESTLNKISPKAGFILTPFRGTTVRGAFTRSIGGASFDESFRLEPSQVAGFTQSYRTIAPEDYISETAGSRFKTWGLSLEQKLPTGTYFGLQYDLLQQDLHRTVGVFDAFQDNFFFQGVLPSSTGQRLAYREDSITATINQIVGENWSFGSRYRYTRSRLHEQFDDVPNALLPNADRTRTSGLHELSLFALYNHPSGFFARAEANWFSQENDQLAPGVSQPRTDPNPGDDFWQINAYAGYRFYRNQCEVSCGFLNITGQDYRLEPLNYYLEIPRDRTVVVRVRFTF